MKTLARLSLAALLAGCGGNVVVDSQVDETSSTTTSSAPPELTCVGVCEKIAAACPSQPGSDCVSGCMQTDQIGNTFCHDVYQAFLVCADVTPAAQCMGQGCIEETNAFVKCLTDACQTNPSACM